MSPTTPAHPHTPDPEPDTGSTSGTGSGSGTSNGNGTGTGTGTGTSTDVRTGPDAGTGTRPDAGTGSGPGAGAGVRTGAGLPWSPLAALALAAFLTLLTEALPAGMLPEMARALAVGEPAMGQALTVYALATGLAALPLARATARWPRRRLLLSAIGAFAVANTVTALSSSYPLTLTVRVLAGVAAAVVWSELVIQARRLAPAPLRGRATAVVLTGIPLAMSLGVPLGTLLGDLVGWRTTFGLVTLVALALIGWIRLSVPESPGAAPGRHEPVLPALRRPGVLAVLTVTAACVLAHNVLYTYIAPFLRVRDAADVRGPALAVLGVASLLSVVATGALVDRHPRRLTVTSVALLTLSTALASAPLHGAGPALVTTLLWGLGWGGLATLLQTAVGNAAGAAGQTLFVTVCNTAIAGGGALGGLALHALGPAALPVTALVLAAPALAVTVSALPTRPATPVRAG
ncbi:MFS transporter (plasmid) [Streptomyces sp. BI20]|uniref:MFS transporter n=1 Tax=Streptomyces sp. BI20 TaxID=3403460 RepID=UPI003C73CB2E